MAISSVKIKLLINFWLGGSGIHLPTYVFVVFRQPNVFVCLGFGFLSFEDEDSVERCVAEHFVNLSGKQVLWTF